jgi:hypothetical protein
VHPHNRNTPTHPAEWFDQLWRFRSQQAAVILDFFWLDFFWERSHHANMMACDPTVGPGLAFEPLYLLLNKMSNAETNNASLGRRQMSTKVAGFLSRHPYFPAAQLRHARLLACPTMTTADQTMQLSAHVPHDGRGGVTSVTTNCCLSCKVR